MDTFAIIGMSFGLMGFMFALNATRRIDKIENKLKALKVLDEEFKSL